MPIRSDGSAWMFDTTTTTLGSACGWIDTWSPQRAPFRIIGVIPTIVPFTGA